MLSIAQIKTAIFVWNLCEARTCEASRESADARASEERVSWRLQWPSLPALVSQPPVESSTMTGLRHTIEAAACLLSFPPRIFNDGCAALASRVPPEMARARAVLFFLSISKVSGTKRNLNHLPFFLSYSFVRHRIGPLSLGV